MKLKGGAFPGTNPEGRGCARPGCPENGDYRAPKHRPNSSFVPPSGPPEWQYFCLTHVREFNAGWDFFEGMDDEDIRRAQSPFPNWDRETRAFAHNLMNDNADRVADSLGVLRWKTAQKGQGPKSRLSKADRQALAKLGLPETATLSEIKSKYRELARRYHPDANAGSRTHEARFTALTEAYQTLSDSPAFKVA